MNYNPLLQSLLEIFDGYSKFDLNGRTLFFKHFSIKDQNSISNSFQFYKNIAVKKGIETESEIFNRLKEDGTWSESDDLKISELENYIENLKRTKQKLFLPSQKENHQKIIDDEEFKLNSLLNTKKELIGISAEEYANRMANEEFLRSLIYEDEKLNKIAFTQEEFGCLTSSELITINESYFKLSKDLNDENIQKIVLEDFYNMYISFCEDTYAFFGKFVYQMTAFQIKLLLYSKIFHNILQYNDDIPENIKKDPKSIFEFIDTKKNREKYQNEVGDSDASMIFGATSKDVEILDPSARKISLSEKLSQNGGSLNMDDMIKLMGN